MKVGGRLSEFLYRDWDFRTSEICPGLCQLISLASLGRQGLGFRKKEGRWKRAYFVSGWFLLQLLALLTAPLPGLTPRKRPALCGRAGGITTLVEFVLWAILRGDSSRHYLFPAMWTWTAYFTSLTLFPHLEIKDNNNDNNNNNSNNYLAQ